VDLVSQSRGDLWGSIAMATAAAALALAVHLALGRWLRRRARRDEIRAERLPTPGNRLRWLVSRSLRDALPPVALLIWIHGGCAAVLALTATMPSDVAASRLRTVVGWVYASGVTAALVWRSVRAGVIVQAALVSRARDADSIWDTVMLPLLGRAARRLFPLLALIAGVSLMNWPTLVERLLDSLSVVLVISVSAWLLFQATNSAALLVLSRYPVEASDNLRARAVHTQVVVLKKIVNAIIGVFAFASILMSFDAGRQLGASILTSAGIAGIVVGLAAQRSVATLLAGVQIALTQPIRVDDVVVVGGEWGRIETITLTYVVVSTWDQRRLIVPITTFIETPFENWTRTSTELLGSVFLQVDYAVPVEALRAELTRILEASQHGDGRVNVLHVTDANTHGIEVRALASAANASSAWELRCEIRERLVGFVQDAYPGCFPRIRTELSAKARGAATAAA
jgi:small-conductance mechanosensitive channel